MGNVFWNIMEIIRNHLVWWSSQVWSSISSCDFWGSHVWGHWRRYVCWCPFSVCYPFSITKWCIIILFTVYQHHIPICLVAVIALTSSSYDCFATLLKWNTPASLKKKITKRHSSENTTQIVTFVGGVMRCFFKHIQPYLTSVFRVFVWYNSAVIQLEYHMFSDINVHHDLTRWAILSIN